MKVNLPAGFFRRRRSWITLAAWVLVAGLLTLALRATPLDQTWEALRLLQRGQILILIGLNLVILTLMALRWWLILRSLKWDGVSLPMLLSYRLVGFGVSFFTPGPQFGGEPVQVDILSRREQVPLSTAVSSVYLDRLFDVLANFTFLALGVTVAVVSGFVTGGAAGWVWAAVVAILALPVGHLMALSRGAFPASWLANRITTGRKNVLWANAREITRQAEERIADFCREQPVTLLFLGLLSGLIWGLMVLEYGLTLRFLGVSPSLSEVIAAMTAGRLALLAPVPGGLGALEASQVLAAQALGWGAQVGLALSLVVRARDFFLALFGIGWGALAYQSILRRDRLVEEPQVVE